MSSLAMLPEILQRPRQRLLIAGRWVDAVSGRTFQSTNPATGEVLTAIAEGDEEDVNRAVSAARQAFEGPWARLKPYERQRLLLALCALVEKHRDEFAFLETLDMGAPIRRTQRTAQVALERLHWYAAQATALRGSTIENSVRESCFSYTLREPVGIVAAIIPWNAPLGSVIWKIGPVLATGCTVVLKPAEEASISPLRFAELCVEAGIPDGVVNVVTGFGETAGAALAAHPEVDKVAFTGSYETGQKIIAASAGNLKRVTLELGGKSPNIVLSDADLETTVPGAALAAFSNSGQICSAGTRLFVEAPIYEEFVGRVAEFGNSLRVGNGLDPDTEVGPLVSKLQLERVTGYLEIGAREGAQALSGGAQLTKGDLATGYFVPPTVFSNVRDDMRIATEEIFGPVITALPFEDLDELARRANATTYGLGSGVWTRDIGKAHKIVRALRAGSVWVNCYQMMDPAVPFGGYKMSGYGREGGVEQFEDYLNTKAVWIRTD